MLTEKNRTTNFHQIFIMKPFEFVLIRKNYSTFFKLSSTSSSTSNAYYQRFFRISIKKTLRFLGYKIKFKPILNLYDNFQKNNGLNISFLINNYFSACFVLVFFKLVLSFFLIKPSFLFNLILLLFFWVFSLIFNLYKKIRNYYIRILDFLIADSVKEEYDGMNEDEIEIIEDRTTILNNISFYFVFFLVGFRILIQENIFLYIICNFIVIQLLLSNSVFFGFTYIYLIVVMLSRLTLYLHFNSHNYIAYKNSLSYYVPNLTNSNIGIKFTYNNVYLLTFLSLRDIPRLNSTYQKKPDYVFNDGFNIEFLRSKFYEQNLDGFHHNFVGEEPKIEIYEKKIKKALFGFFFTIIGPGHKFFEQFLPNVNWQNMVQIQMASKHICLFKYNDSEKKVEIFVATTVHSNKPYLNKILHHAFASKLEYQKGRFQGFSERKLVIENVDCEINFLLDLKKYTNSNLPQKYNTTLTNVEKSFDDVDPMLFQPTFLHKVITDFDPLNNSRNDLEDSRYDNFFSEIIPLKHKIVIFPESFGHETTKESLNHLSELKLHYKTPSILSFFDKAKRMQELTLTQSAVDAIGLPEHNVVSYKKTLIEYPLIE